MGNNKNKIPNVIYQFYDFETGIEKVLKEKTIKFSSPINFNDPFDCSTDLIEFVHDSSNVISKFSEFLEIENYIIDIILKKDKDTGVSILKKYLTEKHRISCFSKTYNEILMWSHYANKHDGICICYNVKNQKGGYFVEVQYPEDDKFEKRTFVYKEPLDKEIEKNNIEAQKHLIKYKSRRWKYEEEVRWVYSNQVHENHKGDVIKNFGDLNIEVKEIIFGLKVPLRKVNNKIKELQLYGYENVSFYQMESVPNEFRIEKKLINTEDIL